MKGSPVYFDFKGTKHCYELLQWAKIPSNFSSDFPLTPGFEYKHKPALAITAFQDYVWKNNIKIELYNTYPSDKETLKIAKNYDAFFQTVPTYESLVHQPKYDYYYVASSSSATDTGNYVTYNGTGEGIASREMQLWGIKYLEFPRYLPYEEICRVMSMKKYYVHYRVDMNPFTKSWLQTEADARRIFLIGKWAEWKRTRELHEVYSICYNFLRQG